MIRFLTAGESHGKALTIIVDGFPSNFNLKKDYIDSHLKRRQVGYGRGVRMKIESDAVEIISGIRFGKTLGSPLSFTIRNSDWENWTERMDQEVNSKNVDKIFIPRPGHADLTGVSKFNLDDIRNSIERSSARETAARVAAGSVARRFLEEFGISVGSYVESLGGIYPENDFFVDLLNNNLNKKFNGWSLSQHADKSDVRVLEQTQETRIINKIKKAKKQGDTLGGTFVTVATGVPVGLGSFTQYDLKLNAEIAHSIMSINAVKGVEIGGGFICSDLFGSENHDEIILKDNILTRKTNMAGGIEGGISTGLPVIVRGSMKPIATLMNPLTSVDLHTMKHIESRRERSDFTAVPACAVIAESMLAWSLAKYFLIKFGGDSLEEIKDNYNSYTKKLQSRIRKNFK
ncbi:MAG: chorismate synthase [Ignavibacteriaceae bacterium]|nr:chorismate synthase [Ignavibacteriaceae bacterium]